MSATPLPAPDSRVQADFPSPAEDVACARINLVKQLVADKYLRPQHGDIVVAVLGAARILVEIIGVWPVFKVQDP